MGLDITALSQLKPVEIPEDIEIWSDEYYDWEADQEGSVWSIRGHSHFPLQAEGIEDGSYIATGEDLGFRAGSYSGYGMWRDWLSKAAYNLSAEQVWDGVDTEGYTGRPFEELINFADNEGIIGPIASKKLYRDFIRYEDKVMDEVDSWYLKQHPTEEINLDDFKWFQEKYHDWKNAFRIASDGGAVMFH